MFTSIRLFQSTVAHQRWSAERPDFKGLDVITFNYACMIAFKATYQDTLSWLPDDIIAGTSELDLESAYTQLPLLMQKGILTQDQTNPHLQCFCEPALQYDLTAEHLYKNVKDNTHGGLDGKKTVYEDLVPQLIKRPAGPEIICRLLVMEEDQDVLLQVIFEFMCLELKIGPGSDLNSFRRARKRLIQLGNDLFTSYQFMYWEQVHKLQEAWKHQCEKKMQQNNRNPVIRIDAVPSLLLDFLCKHFNREELNSLAFRIEVSHEDIKVEKDAGMESFARELIAYVKRRGLLGALIKETLRQRRHLRGRSIYKKLSPFQAK